MGRIAKVIRDNLPLIESLYGNVENIVVKDNYADALKQLIKEDKENKDYYKYQDLLNKITTTKWEDKDNYSDETEIDYSNPDIINSNAYKFYNESIEKQQQDNAGSGVIDFKSYLEKNPLLLAEIQGKYFKNKLKPDEQIKQEYYKRAGLTPEDVQFYETYKEPSRKLYNKRLIDIFNRNSDFLEGQFIGDKYKKMFAKRIADLSLPEEEDKKYEVKIDEKNGKLIYYNPKDPNDIILKTYGEVRKTPTKFDPFGVEADETGKLYYYTNEIDESTGQWIQKKLRYLSDQEIKDYLTEQDRKNKTGVFAKGKSGRGLTGRKKSSSTKDILDEEQTVEQTEEQNNIPVEIAEEGDEGLFWNKYNPITDKFRSEDYALERGKADVYSNPEENPQLLKDIQMNLDSFIEDIQNSTGQEKQMYIDEMYQWMSDNLFNNGLSKSTIEKLYEFVNSAKDQ